MGRVADDEKKNLSESSQLALKWFDEQIHSRVAHMNPDWFVAIDVDRGEFEVDANAIEAGRKLKARLPDARVFMRRVGTHYTYRIGWVPRRRETNILRRIS